MILSLADNKTLKTSLTYISSSETGLLERENKQFRMENRNPSTSSSSTSLKVALGVVRRGVKELEMYRKEVEDGENKLESLSLEDNFYAQTARALEESKTMVRNTHDRLRQAVADLESKLKGISAEDPDLEEAKTWSQKAHTTLTSA